MPRKPAITSSLKTQQHISPHVFQQTALAPLSRIQQEKILWDIEEKNPFLKFRYNSTKSSLFPKLEEEYKDDLAHSPDNSSLSEMREELFGMNISAREKWVGEILISSLLPNGQISVSLASIASYAKVSLEEVTLVFEKLKTIFPFLHTLSKDPLKELLERIFPNPLDLSTALEYWNIILEWSEKSKSKNISSIQMREEVKKEILTRGIFNSSIWDIMEKALEEFLLTKDLLTASHDEQTVVIKPDFIVEKKENVLTLLYWGEIVLETPIKPKHLTKEERLLWKEAKDLKEAWEKQKEFLHKLASFLVKEQSNFFENESLHSFHQKELAKKLKVHPSTISRALKNKTFLFEGHIFPFKVLLAKPLKTKLGEIIPPNVLKTAIKDILEYTNGFRVTDEKLQELLSYKGIHVARRTINKYRHLLAEEGFSKGNKI